MRHIFFIVLAFNMSCANQGFEARPTLVPEESEDAVDLPPPETGDIESRLWFCSDLDFSQMKRPESLGDANLNAFALALNISSTFEGRESWKNITNNFDGMGLSLGLLNQTLGTGSLQPLLVEMFRHHSAELEEIYSPENYMNLKGMLQTWLQQRGQQPLSTTLFASAGEVLSRLDAGVEIKILGAAETASITWAKANLYTDSGGRNFKADWKNQLQTMAGSTSYRDLQFEAALALHNKARNYVDVFNLKQLRSYLFMFDIVVQNGGFYQKNFDDYQAFLQQNPEASEEERLEAILASRLVQVRSQYREDVRARKQSLIDGRGVVHRTDRDYEREYCFERTIVL